MLSKTGQTDRKIINRPVAFIVLIGLFLVLTNTIFNGHIHYLSNGYIVYHAHPYHKQAPGNTGENHQHNSFELFLFNFITYLFGQIVIAIAVWRFYSPKGIFQAALSPIISLKKLFFVQSNRAPPIIYASTNV